jgi:hypothetical protein
VCSKSCPVGWLPNIKISFRFPSINFPTKYVFGLQSQRKASLVRAFGRCGDFLQRSISESCIPIGVSILSKVLIFHWFIKHMIQIPSQIVHSLKDRPNLSHTNTINWLNTVFGVILTTQIFVSNRSWRSAPFLPSGANLRAIWHDCDFGSDLKSACSKSDKIEDIKRIERDIESRCFAPELAWKSWGR